MGARYTVAHVLECMFREGLFVRVSMGADKRLPFGELPFEFTNLTISDITFNSRACKANSAFICKGATFKEEYLLQAIQNGAVIYISEKPYACASIPGIIVKDIRSAMACLATSFFEDPSQKLKLVAITGTKGKTTISFYVRTILQQSLKFEDKNGIIGGVMIDDGVSCESSHNTTPESVELQRHLSNAVHAGYTVMIMEASSQGLKYQRTAGCAFNIGCFTNIGEDHISDIEHPTFEDYFSSKLMMFKQTEHAIVNLDSDYFDRILQAASVCRDIMTYSLHNSQADLYLTSLNHKGEGVWLCEASYKGETFTFELPALGVFNVSNALAAIAICLRLDVKLEDIIKGLAHVSVPGRTEIYTTPDKSLVGIVDYAHNGMSLDALLASVKEAYPERRLIVVFGATGNRGTHRREGLGKAAAAHADVIILTEDDPADTPLAEICEEVGRPILAAGKTYTVIDDRQKAVRRAVNLAKQESSVVILAGKGIEDSIVRAEGTVSYPTDAAVLCQEFGLPWNGYRTA
ncbi:MAG: UDP-N-acetylmuramoyl-L-alanyl-D-glutamate--2,6-diaminopimelate ligase [Coriobacteriales bacterium]|nr:UDP-N-acetylmuramoyl-L-alanyl-D-glutamate--2,6-diaminopimelate ligase [Coriobacteriales bacterium]